MRDDEDRRVERRFFGPTHLAEVEHPLAHDAHARPVEDLLEELVVRPGVTALAEFQPLPEYALLHDPAVQVTPAVTAHVLNARVRPLDAAIERHTHADEYLGHVGLPAFIP